MKISLKALRINAGKSQDDVASEVKVTKKTIQNWEQYKTYPNAAQLVKLCSVYGCTLDDIFLPDVLAKSEVV